MMLYFPVISIIIWLIVGAVCGWLETERLAGKLFSLPTNIAFGILGAFLGGWFFFIWGDLVPGDLYLSPFVSGLIGSGFSLSILGLFGSIGRRLTNN
jgi:uncharacterized membrane protein YeaQ/YmgE (transglycosylase-associated protein family)